MQSGSRNHGLSVLDVVSEANGTFEAMQAGDHQAALRCIDRMVLSEREADRIESKLCAEITDGTLGVEERQDLLELVRESDLIADYANEAGIYAQMIIDLGVEVPQELWADIRQMARELLLEVKMFVRALEAIDADHVEVRRCIESIKDQERIIDDLNYSTMKKILMSDMEYKGVMLVTGLIKDLERSSDECKHSAETIQIIISAGRPRRCPGCSEPAASGAWSTRA